MDKFKIGVVSLGCDKNRVDAEIMIGKLTNEFSIVSDAKIADIIIVNTCGFIEASKQESINTIVEMAEYKEKHNCKILVVTGCLSGRYGKELMELLPEVDIMLGTNDYETLINDIREFIKNKEKICSCNYSDSIINEGDRVLTTPNYSAYLRIAEGCNNFCTYCIIPKIRGKYRSRKIENIIKEGEELAKRGVKELIVVAQDTTRYGSDIYGEKKLPELLRELSKIEGVEWIRVLYCYPEEISDDLINELASNDKICKYLDLPMQHISNSVLKRMGRRGSKEEIIEVINKLKERIEGVVIRTSIIVGFPGENEADFEELKDFVQEMKIDKLGVFKYSPEEGTPAAIMKEQIVDEIKEQREEDIMILQQAVSLSLNEQKIGKTYKVIVEGFNGNMWYGRNYEMTPEIDGAIYFEADKNLKVGEFVNIKINRCLEYDLIGDVCYESC